MALQEGKKMNIRKNAEIRKQPIENQRRINVVVSESDLKRLKVAAATLDTTVNEIIRGLIVDFIGTPKDLDDIQPF